MKKLLLVIAISIFFLTSTESHAQEDGFLIGLNYGVPVADLNYTSLFNVGADVNYLFDISETFQMGPLVGYSSFIRKRGNDFSSNYKFIPLAGTIRANLFERLLVGGDLGYGYGINDDIDGGIFYRFKVGYLSEYGNLTLSYSSIHTDYSIQTGIHTFTENATFSTVNLGVEFNL